jgi:hypothetical protein
LSRVKRTFVHALVIGFTLWPAVHLTLARVYGVNPWKLGGWGMYAAPQLQPSVRVFGLTADEVGVYELITLPSEVQPTMERFLGRRRALGDLASPDALAGELLGHYRAIDGVRLEVRQPVLERRSGMIRETIRNFEYPRGFDD